jgi:hypothetical protein
MQGQSRLYMCYVVLVIAVFLHSPVVAVLDIGGGCT